LKDARAAADAAGLLDAAVDGTAERYANGSALADDPSTTDDTAVLGNLPAFGPERVVARAVSAIARQTEPGLEAVVVHDPDEANRAGGVSGA
jgi:hypothetical protein